MAVTTDSSDSAAAATLRRVVVAALIVLVLLAAMGAAFRIAHDNAARTQAERLGVSAQSRAQTLESILGKQRAVATVLSDDAAVRQALVDPSPESVARVSRKFERLREQTGSAVIYLLDRSGVAIAASNWDNPDSFIGSDYSFRSYFSDALLRGEATQFALGTVSKRPGLYLSHDVSQAGTALGVIVVKVEFDALETAWAQAAETTIVTGSDGQVILSSQPGLRFAPLPLPGAGQVSARRDIAGAGWVLWVRAPAAEATRSALLAAGTVGFLGLLVLGAGLWLARARTRTARRIATERRYRADLERAVAERTRDLTAEMRERRAAEQRLAHLQGELVQANKLATLGQITAGVAHEVNTPLATIRLLAENGRSLLGQSQPEVHRNLGQILRMSDRIAQITTELRGFARKATGELALVSIRDALDAALLLTASRRRAQNIRLVQPEIPPDLRVMAETVRLEQILVNLIQNATEALEGRPDPEIRITLQEGPMLRLSISDNGPGLSPQIAAQLFTPFATTKPGGLGLGLVISQDIARDFGGSLTAGPVVAGAGATFHLDLPRAP
ncbi:sensor histidine kinase [Paracoccus sp. SMMA_5]|uniref:sensor histidine kinase n=1 Tax=Paracoccus sp. SMMA_5 TaxID=2654281 RepID=UPI0021E1C832|nr:ATP-binding protein [Paracoccus sp. SMMA_5]UXU74742.1 ATP-binding protein [Paracoccus sp. SMMA_5]